MSSKNPTILPLDYCRIDRAAALLGCEVDDIIHWGETAKVSLRIPASVLPIISSVVSYQGPRIDDVRTKVERAIQLCGMVVEVNNHASINLQPAIDDSPSLQEEDMLFIGVALELEGLWIVPPEALRRDFMNLPDEYFGKDTAIIELHEYDESAQQGMFHIFATISSEFDRDVFMSNLTIMREDLLLLQRHISNGTPIPTKNLMVGTEHGVNKTAAAPESPKEQIKTHQEQGYLTSQHDADLAKHAAELSSRLLQAEAEITALKLKSHVFRHMTPLLELVAEVQERYWGENWDRNDPDTTTKQADIIEWVIKDPRCNSKKRAELVAIVARPEI